MRYFLLSFILLIFMFGNAQQWERAKAFGHLPKNSNYCKVVDEEGNIYIAGNIDQNLFWVDNEMVYAKEGGRDLFLLKLDSNFNKVWLKTWNNVGAEIPKDLVQDVKGELILYGTFSERFILGNDTLQSPNEFDAFLAKFDTMGNVKWAYAYKGLLPNQMNCDKDGNIYFNGNIGVYEDRVKTTLDMNGIALTTYGAQDIFIGCCLPSGKMKWAKNLGSKFSDYGNMFFYDNTIYIIGSSSGEFYYTPNDYYKNNDEYDYGFLIKMDYSGYVHWINSIALLAAGTCGISLISVDSDENILAYGGAYCIDRDPYCQVKLENFKITAEYWPIDFMVRFNRDGKALWLKKFKFENYFYPQKMIFLSNNHFIFTNGTKIYEIDSLANRIDYNKDKLHHDFKNSSEPNIINNGKIWVVGEYNNTPFKLGDINLPKPDVDYNLFVGRANFLDKKPVGEIIPLRNKLRIYPNPSDNILNIEFTSNKRERYSMKLFSSQGQLIDEFTIHENLVLSLTKYKSGLYLVVLSNSKETETHKISIKH